MSEQASSGSRSGGPRSNVVLHGFLPGLVLGIVVGAVVVFLSTEIIGKQPKFELGHEATPGVTSDRDSREGGVSPQDLERMAREAREAAGDGDDSPPEPADDD